MFSDNWIGVHEAADDVGKDLTVDNRRTEMLHKHLYLQDNYHAW